MYRQPSLILDSIFVVANAIEKFSCLEYENVYEDCRNGQSSYTKKGNPTLFEYPIHIFQLVLKVIQMIRENLYQ